MPGNQASGPFVWIVVIATIVYALCIAPSDKAFVPKPNGVVVTGVETAPVHVTPLPRSR